MKYAPDLAHRMIARVFNNEVALLKHRNMAMINYKEPQFKKMLHNMDRVSMSDKQLREHVKKYLAKAFLLIEQYIPGFDLTNVREERAKALFSEEACKCYNNNPAVLGFHPEDDGLEHLVKYSILTQIGI